MLKMWLLGHVNHPFCASIIYIFKFHYLENSTSMFCKYLHRYYHVYTITKLLFIPSRFGAVVKVGLMMATIVINFVIMDFLTYN